MHEPGEDRQTRDRRVYEELRTIRNAPEQPEGDPRWFNVMAVLWYIAAVAFCFGMIFWAVRQVSG